MDDWLKTPSTNYAKDLLWRRAQNYRAMGRDWEAYWGFKGLLLDYPDVDTDLKEKYLYASIIQALKIGKIEEAMALAEQSLASPDYHQFVGEIGQLLANIYLQKAQEWMQKSESADTFPEMEAFRKKAVETYREMWEVCEMLLDKQLKPENMDSIISLIGSSWINLGETDQWMWEELVHFFEARIAKDSDNPSNHGFHYWAGLAHLYKQQYDKGHLHFDKIFKEYPQSKYLEDATFRRGVCAKGMEDLETARSNFSEFINKFPKNRLVVDASVFLGDIARDEERFDEAEKHYLHVLYGIAYDDFPRDSTFSNHALHEVLDIVKKPKTRKAYEKAKRILITYLPVCPVNDKPKVEREIAIINELLGDPVAYLEGLLRIIETQGNIRESSSVDTILTEYFQKQHKYHQQYSDTLRFFTKLRENAKWRNRVLSDRQELLKILPEYPHMIIATRDHFLDIEFSKSVLQDISKIDDDFRHVQGILKSIKDLEPVLKLTELFEVSIKDGRETLAYRLMRLFHQRNIMEPIQDHLPLYFTKTHFEKASAETLFWMAEYNLANGSNFSYKRSQESSSDNLS